ncbi:MAG TPA: CehA/McbA family metallohydrolase [Bryobacteraceae bacterium]|nr:CehA/McbA family metallohydrolase [Bryobacteraceae bacterium]
MRRFCLSLSFASLIGLALWKNPEAKALQGAVSHSKPGQEDLTFWINHNGLEQLEVDGEVGFGDMARVLMRRRSNSEAMRGLRDRFVFRQPAVATLAGFTTPSRYVIAQQRVFNLPSIRDGKAILHRVLEPKPGSVERTFDGRTFTFDVRPLHKLKVNLRDEHGKPTTARVYLTAADGLAYAPKGTISRYAAQPAEQFFHAADSFEMQLPAGETIVEASRGVEYELVRQTVQLTKPSEITVRLKRWIDLPARGWYSSDAHIHANYTAPHHQDITAEDVRMYTVGEDLHLPNMMVANSSGDTVHDRKFFEGKLSALSSPPYLVYWNEEMRNSGLYGHMCFFRLKTLVEPLYTGFRGSQQPDDYPPNYTQAKAAQDQGGAVTYAHPGYAANFDGASMKEMPVDLALGQIDAMDVLSNNPEEVAMEMWYRLLNCGFRVGISAGTDSFTNVADHYVPGGGRVYAHLAGPLRYEDWVTAFKQGRTFATNGPMLFLKVDGKEPGEELRFAAGSRKLKIQLESKSAIPVDAVELVINGKPRPLSSTVEIDRSSWIAARVTGPSHRMVLNDTRAFAHTSPVYVYLGGTPVQSQPDARFWVEWIDRLMERTSQRGVFSTPARKREVLDLFQKARAVYARQL